MTPQTKVTDLHTLFNQADEIYYRSKETTSTELSSITDSIELPVLDEGVTFDTGSADVTRVNLTTGRIWSARVSKGDPDISFQVSTLDARVNEIMLNKLSDISDVTTLVNSVTMEGGSYSLEPKNIKGSLILFSKDRKTVIVLPSIEAYSSLVLVDGDNPAYYNLVVTPMANSEGADIFILWEKEGDGES